MARILLIAALVIGSHSTASIDLVCAASSFYKKLIKVLNRKKENKVNTWKEKEIYKIIDGNEFIV